MIYKENIFFFRKMFIVTDLVSLNYTGVKKCIRQTRRKYIFGSLKNMACPNLTTVKNC